MKKILAILMILAMLVPFASAESVPSSGTERGGIAVDNLGLREIAVQLLNAVTPLLKDDTYTLTLEDGYGYPTRLTASAFNGRLILELSVYGGTVRIELTPDAVLLSEGNNAMSFSYEQLEEMLAEELGMPGFRSGGLTSLFSGTESLGFLQEALSGLVPMLEEAGVISEFRRMNGGMMLNLSLSPETLTNAAVRWVDGLMAHSREIDTLLIQWDSALRLIAPDLFREYSRESESYIVREAPLTYAEVLSAWTDFRQNDWMNYGIDAGGIHADLNLFIYGDRWQADLIAGSEYGEEGLYLSLEGSDMEFEGRLSCGYEARVSGEYVRQLTSFRIEGLIVDGLRLKVVPEQPTEGFTALLVTASARNGLALHASSDLFSLNAGCFDGALDASFLVGDFVAELHAVFADGTPEGSFLFRDGYDSYSLTLTSR